MKIKKTIVLLVIISTAIFLAVLSREYSALKKYMDYISENGRSALFHEEFINQNIAFQLTRTFSGNQSVMPPKEIQALCQQMETVNGVSGLNLTTHRYKNLPGTLQTRNASCQQWAADTVALAMINTLPSMPWSKYSFSNYTGYAFNNVRYYIDLFNQYIYINRLVDARTYTFNNWLIKNKDNIDIDSNAHTISIDKMGLHDLHSGENIVSHVYQDNYSKNNIISMLTPVFQNNEIKGIIITDINIRDLATSFYISDRPLLWEFLSIYIKDNSTGETIDFHTPAYTTTSIIHYQDNITRYYTLNIKVDALYFIIANIWIFIVYVLSTYLVCVYVNRHIVRHTSLSQENVTDAMTGLYNRKLFSPFFDRKIRSLLDKKIPVTVVAIDCDGLKKINDTMGHHMGDVAIQSLGKAISQSIRKSDYGIRLGGDEFSIILIDYTRAKANELVERIAQALTEIDAENMVTFSFGSYEMQSNDTTETALLKADALLYQHKRNKYPQ